MENIAVHIEKLLTRHECIIVPGLGGFLSYKESAAIKGLQLDSPHRSIRFNALLSYQDGLLAESIMQSENIGYKAAVSIIEREVQALRVKLSGGVAVQFGHIGRFLSDGDNAILFSSGDCRFLPENLGCQPVYLKKLEPITQPAAGRRNIVIQLPAHNSSIWRYAAAIAVIFTLSIIMPARVEHGTLRAVMPLTLLTDNDMPAPTTVDTATEEIEQAIETDASTLSGVNILAQPTASIEINADNHVIHKTDLPSADRYHLIIASLPKRALAEKYIREQNQFPRETLHIIECNGKYRISAASFATRSAALQQLDTIRLSQNAWILHH